MFNPEKTTRSILKKFETLGEFEKYDSESNYFIYSNEGERELELNWLLDIQLYSSRFENSRILDIKSEFDIVVMMLMQMNYFQMSHSSLKTQR